MPLQAGLRIALGPRFHSDLPWADRLRLNSGITIEQGQRLPRPDWRPLSADDLELLVRQGVGNWERDCCCWRLPEHLRRLWWDRAAGELLDAGGEQSGYKAFLVEVAAFARFKGVPLLPACRFDVLARPPGQRSPLTEDREAPLLAVVNLGDEATAVVLGNRPGSREEIDYPLVRLQLPPGDGCWLPAGCRAWPADTTDKTDLDVLLLLRAGDLASGGQQPER